MDDIMLNNLLTFLLLVLILTGCDDQSAWNNPYPQFKDSDNILFTAFTERPKHLDPAVSYTESEAVITFQVYEPPLQYHYLKRPYELTTLAAESLPSVTYIDQTGKILPENDPNIAFSLYQIKIKPGIFYQEHPAFATDPTTGRYLYHDLTLPEVKNKHTLNDFPERGTRELVAEDYVYEIKRLADPTVNSPIFGVMENYLAGLSELHKKLQSQYQEKNNKKNKPFLDLRDFPLEGARIIDKYTYEIKIKGRYPQFSYWLAMPFFAPIPWEGAKFYSQEVLQKRNITLDWFPIGTGPFILIKNNPNSEMILQKNPHYHGEFYPHEGETGDKENGFLKKANLPIPFIDKIVFVLERENIPYWNKFLQGYYDQAGVSTNNFDQVFNVSGSNVLELSKEMKNKGMSLYASVAPTIFYWGCNMLDETVGGYTTEKRKLRQALAIAMDMEEYINIFLNGRGVVAESPLPAGIFGHVASPLGINPNTHQINPTTQQVERKSISEAKKLLKEAGYPNGIDPKTKLPLILYYDTPLGSGPDSAAQLSWIRKQFEKLGIDLVVRGTQYNRFQDKMAHGDFQLYSWGWNADYPDPENFLFLLLGKNSKVKFAGENTSNYMDPEFDALFEQMKVMPNTPERMKIIIKMLNIIQRDVPWFGGYFPKTYVLRQSWIQSLKPNEMARNAVKYISIDPEKRASLRKKWNQPIVWPIILGMLLLVVLFIPAGVSYWSKMYRSLKLRK